MELLQLRYFCMTAKNENISQTAERFRVPPSSVSHTISKLEKEIGTSLFDRTKNRITLNENGRKLAAAVELSLKTLDDGLKSILNGGEELTGALRVLTWARLPVIVECSYEFQRIYPKLSFEIAHYATKGIDVSNYDLFIAFEPPELGSVGAVKLCDYDTMLIVSKNNPLADLTEVSVDQLRNESFFVVDKNTPMWRQVAQMCRKCGFEPRASISSDILFTPYIDQNLGSLLSLRRPGPKFKRVISENSVALRVKGTKTLTLCIYWDASRPLSKTAEMYRNFIVDYFKDHD